MTQFDDQPDDRPLEPPLDALARAYHAPGEAPVEAMWARIAARRADVPARRPSAGEVPPPLAPHEPTPVIDLASRRRRLPAWLAAAAVLALGIGIGRYALPGDPTAAPAVAAAPDAAPPAAGANAGARTAAFEVAAAAHLAQTETFLELFRDAARDGRTGTVPVEGVRSLLSSNRLLLDSPAAADPRLRPLLEDLELVLMEIAQYGATRRASDLDLITDGLEQGGVLSRLRVTTAASGRPLAEGVL